MTYKHFVQIAGVTLIMGATLHAQIGPVPVVAGKKQDIVRVAQGKVEIKRAATLGTAVAATENATTLISYTAGAVTERKEDSFTYSIDGGGEQVVNLQIAPATFDLDRETYEKIFKALFLLFILALVLESGLALLFNWRPFVETFNARATKPVVSLIFAYIFVEQFDLDLMSAMVTAASSNTEPAGTPGLIITAMVLAGGSAAVNNIMIALGFRQKRTPETATPKPPPTKAWIAFKLDRENAVGPVEVFVSPTPMPKSLALPFVGMINGSSRPGVRFFFRDEGRFPPFAGYEVTPNVPYSFALTGFDANGKAVTPYERHDLIIAPGAIIDLEVKL